MGGPSVRDRGNRLRRVCLAMLFATFAATLGIPAPADGQSPPVSDPRIALATYVGSNQTDSVVAVETGASGAIYVFGRLENYQTTLSFPNWKNVPLLNPTFSTAACYLTKIVPDGQGGSSSAWTAILTETAGCHAMTLAPNGEVFVARSGAGNMSFIESFSDASGTLVRTRVYELPWATGIFRLKADAAGNAYALGACAQEFSLDDLWPFPRGAHPEPDGGACRSPSIDTQHVLTMTDANGDLTYGTFVGKPNGQLAAQSLDIDAGGRVYVAGITTADGVTDVTANAFQRIPGIASCVGAGCTDLDGFLMAFNPSPALSGIDTLSYSSYFGGSGREHAVGLALGPDGLVNLTGVTSSSDFPLTTADTVTGAAVFASRLDLGRPPTNQLVSSAIVLHSDLTTVSEPPAIRVLPSREIALLMQSSDAAFPFVNPVYSAPPDPTKATGKPLLLVYDPSTRAVTFSSFLDDTQLAKNPRIAVDAAGRLDVAMVTSESGRSTDGSVRLGGDDVLVVGIDRTPPNTLPTVVNVSPTTWTATSPNGAFVQLGAYADDPDGDTLNALWTGPFADAHGFQTTVRVPIGTHPITLKVDDGPGGHVVSLQFQLTVSDTNTVAGVFGVNNGQTVVPPDDRFADFRGVTAGKVEVTFQGTVGIPGLTWLRTRIDQIPPPPAGLQLGSAPLYYDLSYRPAIDAGPTGSVSGPVWVCVDFTGMSFVDPGAVRLHRLANGAWTDVTSSIDLASQHICAAVAGDGAFGTYAIFTPAQPATQMTQIATGVNQPGTVALDAARNYLYVAEISRLRVWRVNLIDGSPALVAGDGTVGSATPLDGVDARTSPVAAHRLAVDAAGNLFIAETGWCRIRRIDFDPGNAIADYTITTVAGIGPDPLVGSTSCAHSGDGGPSGVAGLELVGRLAFDRAGNLLLTELHWNGADGGFIRRIAAGANGRIVDGSGTITTIAGNGTQDFPVDGASALDIGLFPWDVAANASGELFVASSSTIVRIGLDGRVTRLAGTDSGLAWGLPYFGDGGLARDALIDTPMSIAILSDGSVVYGDTGLNRIRRVTTDGRIATIAGFTDESILTPTPPSNGDGLALSTRLGYPNQLVAAPGNGLLMVEPGFGVVRRFGTLVTPYPAAALSVNNVTGIPGSVVRLHATLAANGKPLANQPVTFLLNGVAASSAPVTTDANGVASGDATLPIVPGFYAGGLQATFAGDASIGIGGATARADLTVAAAATSLALTTSGSPSAFGDTVTLTATIASPYAPPSGNIAFSYQVGATTAQIGIRPIGAGGIAAIDASNLPPGTLTVFASYAGDVTFAGRTASVIQVVASAPTATTLTSSRNLSITTAPPIFTATVSVQLRESPTALTGKIEFLADGVLLCRSTVFVRSGASVARCGGATLAAGDHTITARYSGDASYDPSESPALAQTIREGLYVAIDLGVTGEATAISPNGRFIVGSTPDLANNTSNAFYYDASENSSSLVFDAAGHIMPTLGGPTTVAADVDDFGSVVGTARTAQQLSRGFLFRPGDLGLSEINPFGGSISSATRVSGGAIIGFASVGSGLHAFLDGHGNPTDLGTLGGANSGALDISEQGTIVGVAALPDGSNRAAIFGSPTIDLGTLGGQTSLAASVNNAAEVAGVAAVADGSQHAFAYRDGSMTDLTASVSVVSSAARKINDAGEVVGSFDLLADIAVGPTDPARHIFLSRLGTLLDIGLGSVADINNAGQFVGTSTVAFKTAAFVHNGQTGQSLVPMGGAPQAGPASSTALAINDLGEIVGSITRVNAGPRATLWKPVGAGQLTLSPASGRPNDSIAVRAHLQSVLEETIAGQLVSFSIDGQVVGTGVTDGAGNVTSPLFGLATFAEGVYTGIVTATFDGDPGAGPATATGDLTVHGNAAPVLTLQSSSVTVDESQTLIVNVTASDPDGDPVSTTLSGLAPGFIPRPSFTAGVITWTPSEAQGPGTYVFTIHAEDNQTPPASADTQLTVIVNEVNLPPAVEVPQLPAVIGDGVPFTFTATAADPDSPANTFAFTLVDAPTQSGTGAPAIDAATGAFTWMPAASQAGQTFTFRVRATDNGVPPLSGEKAVSVTVRSRIDEMVHVNDEVSVNGAPMLAPLSNLTVDAGQLVSFLLTAVDDPADALQFAIELPATLPDDARLSRIDAHNARFSWTPTASRAGADWVFTVRVTDNHAPSFADVKSFTIHVNERPVDDVIHVTDDIISVNGAPMLAPLSNRTVDAGQLVSFVITAVDDPADALQLAIDLPAALSDEARLIPIDSRNVRFSWTPAADRAGTDWVFTVRVADNHTPPLADVKSFMVRVNDTPIDEPITVTDDVSANAAPLLGALADRTAAESATLSFAVTAIDSPADTLAFSFVNAVPAGAQLIPVGGHSAQFTWTPRHADIGQVFTFTVRATDDGTPAASSQRSFTVTVLAGSLVGPGTTTVSPLDQNGQPSNVRMTFEGGISSPGTVLVRVGVAAPALPPGFVLSGRPAVFYDIVTTAGTRPPITVCIDAGPMRVPNRLLHFNASAGLWEDRTILPVPPNGPICASVDSLSPFAVVEPINQAPTANAGPNQIVEATSPAGARVTLSGTAIDPDGDPLTFTWTEGATVLGTGKVLTIARSPGIQTITLTVSDSRGGTATASVQITVRDSTPPIVTPPANIDVPATEASGVRASAWPALAAWLAAGSATDLVDAAPARLLPQSNGVDVGATTLVPTGTTSVVFRFRDASGNVGTATAAVTVKVGVPVIDVRMTGSGTFGGRKRYVELEFRNTGSGIAVNATSLVVLLTSKGSGQATLAAPALPIGIGRLNPSEVRVVRLTLDVPASVKEIVIVEAGAFFNVKAQPLIFAGLQRFVP